MNKRISPKLSLLSLALSLSFAGAVQAATTVPATIQAENYSDYYDTTSANLGGKYKSDGVDIQSTSDQGGGYNVGWTADSEWLAYEIQVNQTGTYNAEFRVASKPGNAKFQVLVNGVQVASQSLSATGGWQQWQTKTLELGTLHQGQHTLKVLFEKGNMNLNWLKINQLDDDQGGDINPGVFTVPAKIQAEDFHRYYDTSSGNNGGEYRNTDVDIESSSDTGGGYNIGWIDVNEWLEYDINASQQGNYTADLRVASELGSAMADIYLDGVKKDSKWISDTGNWQSYVTLSANLGSLSAGNHKLRIQFPKGRANFNWLELKKDGDNNTTPIMLGKFDISKDLFVANFDSKPDPDDIHAIAALGTMLRDSRFANVNYHAVMGAYGTQGGSFIDSTDLFKMCFDNNWSHAHDNYNNAVETVFNKVAATLQAGGDVWIEEAGQSDFTADVVRKVKQIYPNVNTASRIHVVQHSDWNERMTSANDLTYVKQQTDYSKIADGNSRNNGTPGFNTKDTGQWAKVMANSKTSDIWGEARSVANANNAHAGYDNPSIAQGGFDFSDTVEATWIFGFNDLKGVNEFFNAFPQ